MDTLIAEDLLLLLLDDDSGKVTHGSYLDIGVGGAMLVQLALGGVVEVTERSGVWSKAKVRPTGVTAPADPLLRDSLDLVAEKERSAQDLVSRLGKKRKDALLERLVERGIVERHEDSVLGLFPRTRWPARDSTHEAGVRRQLGDALVRGQQPDERTTALISLLSAMDLAHQVIDREGLPARDLKRRAKEIADGDWAAKGVKDAIAAAQAAITAAVIATTAATTASSS